jgi:hypothetical protein
MPIIAGGPSLELAVEITAADGTQYRWGPGRRAADVPQGLGFKTKQGEGFADGAVTLARRVDREYADLHILDSVVITGADGSIAYEGRVEALPRTMQDAHQVAAAFTGWMAHMRDRKAREIYVDRDLSVWRDPSIVRRSNLTSYIVGSMSQGADADTNRAGIITGWNGAWATKAVSEAWYDAGALSKIASVYLEWTKRSSISPADTNWDWDLWRSDSDASGETRLGGNLRAAGPGAGRYTFTTPARYAMLQLAYAAAGGADVEYTIAWQNLALYGDHGLPLIGTEPMGVAASDVIKHVIGKYCPLLNTDGVQATTYPIPHLVFREGTDPYDVVLDVNKYHLWQFGVFENRTFHYGPLDLTDYDWQIRLSDEGTTLTLQGDSTESVANGITVTFQDISTGNTNVVTPDQHAELRDTDPANPYNAHGIQHWEEVTLSAPSTVEGALQYGRAKLAEINQPKAPGSITVQGHIRDRAGHWQPVWKVRNGHRIAIVDHPNDPPRPVIETDYVHDTKTITIAVDSTFSRLDAAVDRLTTSLSAASLT